MSRPDRLDTLLARGHLGGPGREAVFSKVVALTAYRRRWRLPALAGSLVLGGAVAVALFVVPPRDSALRAKGIRTGATVSVGCLEDGPGVCRAGGTVVLTLTGVGRTGYVAAFLQGPTGERKWLFPEDALPAFTPSSDPVVLRDAAHLDSTEVPGRHRLVVVITDRPAARGHILTAMGAGELEVLESVLEVR